MARQPATRLPREVILYGGTGQALLVRAILGQQGSEVIAVFDDTPGLPSPFRDVPIYRGWQAFLAWRGEHPSRTAGFCVTIGNPHGRVRLRLHDSLEATGLVPTTVIHPAAWVAADAEIGAGCQIMAGAIIQPEARLGRQCIINALSYLDHQTSLGEGCELAAGSKVMGHTEIGSNTLIGVSAVVLSRLRIGNNVSISAGSIVAADVGNDVTLAGITSREQ